MRQPAFMLTLSTLGACTTTPLPPMDPQHAWVDMYTNSGKMVMAEQLDGQHLHDGRYFQVPPGKHELIVRFDFEVPGGGGLMNSNNMERICYLTVRYDNFQAGQRYRLEARALTLRPNAYLYDSERKVVAEDRAVNCLL